MVVVLQMVYDVYKKWKLHEQHKQSIPDALSQQCARHKCYCPGEMSSEVPAQVFGELSGEMFREVCCEVLAKVSAGGSGDVSREPSKDECGERCCEVSSDESAKLSLSQESVTLEVAPPV